MDNNQNGFTLIEILVTLAILSIGLLGMAALTIEIIRTMPRARRIPKRQFWPRTSWKR
jgi:prepilin-type N-terminal cleavage/methylation domain